MQFSAVSLVCLLLFVQVHQLYSQNLLGFRLFDLNPDIFRTSVNYSLSGKLLTLKSLPYFRHYHRQPQLIRSRGFDVEQHQVTTADGYILTVFRIVNRYLQNGSLPNGRTRPRPLILWHGIAVSSESWLFSTPGGINSSGVYVEYGNVVNDCNTTVTSTLSYTLAACGYDVWLPNSHQRYWQFTLTELAIYDVPAVINSLGYIGHSLGTDQMFVLQSLMPEVGQIIRPYIALAPIAYLGNIWSVVRPFVPIGTGVLRFLPGPLGLPPAVMQFLGAFICGNDFVLDFCAELFKSVNGADPSNFNRSLVPVNMGHSAAVTSTWIYAHLAQLVASNRYGMMDFGPTENMQRYGTEQPPAYPLANITSANIALFRGLNDPLADNVDVERLVRELNVPLLDNYIVPFPKWSHQDFQLGTSQGFYVNRRLLQLLQPFN
ncbi:Alpha/beta-hydrolase lipase region [Tyrophagus putrescentiae]|nr:Alpha/beta-hydrolase lipase region [Tyrophagus putrescentiae]